MNTKHIREEGFMKIKSYSIRIEQDLLHKLHYMAAYDGRLANSQVLYYIKQAVATFEKKNGLPPGTVKKPKTPSPVLNRR